MADLFPPAGTDGFSESFVDQVAGLGGAETAQVVQERRELQRNGTRVQFANNIVGQPSPERICPYGAVRSNQAIAYYLCQVLKGYGPMVHGTIEPSNRL